jgi:hypothetical protein
MILGAGCGRSWPRSEKRALLIRRRGGRPSPVPIDELERRYSVTIERGSGIGVVGPRNPSHHNPTGDKMKITKFRPPRCRRYYIEVGGDQFDVHREAVARVRRPLRRMERVRHAQSPRRHLAALPPAGGLDARRRAVRHDDHHRARDLRRGDRTQGCRVVHAVSHDACVVPDRAPQRRVILQRPEGARQRRAVPVSWLFRGSWLRTRGSHTVGVLFWRTRPDAQDAAPARQTPRRTRTTPASSKRSERRALTSRYSTLS